MIATLFDDDCGAVISPCERYRYRLWRRWAGGPAVAFVMLNPSTADASLDDPTIRRCIGFARSWGYGTLMVGNLFALRSTDPKALYRAPDPVGPDNDAALVAIASEAEMVVCAWGNHGRLNGRSTAVTALLDRAGTAPMCLSLSKSGQPGHPLYLRADLRPVAMATREAE